MKINLIYNSLIGVLFLLNSFLCYKLFTNYKNFQNIEIQRTEEIANLSNRENKIEEFFEYQFTIERLLSEYLIRDKYSKWLGTSHIVVLFNENQCMTCIQQIILDFLLIKQRTNFSNFVLLGSFRTEYDFSELTNQLDSEFSHEFLQDDYKFFKNLEYPLVLVIDKRLDIRYIYSPDLLPRKRSWYFYTLLINYIKNNSV